MTHDNIVPVTPNKTVLHSQKINNKNACHIGWTTFESTNTIWIL